MTPISLVSLDHPAQRVKLQIRTPVNVRHCHLPAANVDPYTCQRLLFVRNSPQQTNIFQTTSQIQTSCGPNPTGCCFPTLAPFQLGPTQRPVGPRPNSIPPADLNSRPQPRYQPVRQMSGATCRAGVGCGQRSSRPQTSLAPPPATGRTARRVPRPASHPAAGRAGDRHRRAAAARPSSAAQSTGQADKAAQGARAAVSRCWLVMGVAEADGRLPDTGHSGPQLSRRRHTAQSPAAHSTAVVSRGSFPAPRLAPRPLPARSTPAPRPLPARSTPAPRLLPARSPVYIPGVGIIAATITGTMEPTDPAGTAPSL